jgi:phosphoesterase RecJ-like protein
MNPAYQKMIDFLHTQKNMIICGHEQPDADCLGSMLAVYHAFDGKNKNWRLVGPDQPAPNLTYLPGIEHLLQPEQIDIEVEAVLILDCRGLHRTGLWLEPYLAGRRVFCADHHLGDVFDGEHIILEHHAAATTEIIGAVIEQAGIELDIDTAICLYSGLMSDTGGFRFPNTTVRALEQAAKMLPLIDIETITMHVFEQSTMANLRVKGYCCNNLQLLAEGRICYAVLSQDTMRDIDADKADVTGVVNYTLYPQGVRLGILFEEQEQFIKVSFRSRRGTSANALARSLGGGGHELASGVRINEPLSIAVEKVLAAAKEMFDQ